MTGFPDHVIDAAFGVDALAATHRRAEQQRACICWDGNPENFEGPQRDCPTHGEKAEQQPRWLAGLIAKHGEPTSRQTDVRREWHWGEERGVEICWSGGFGSVDAWQPDRMASVALRSEPTDAEISGVVALAGLAGLDDAPDGLAS